jgi:CMP-N-acetylneuraminic acid synthetase
MKTIAIIPARGGSKRLLRKNMLPLGGIPLVAHSIEEALKHDFISDVFVTTDDEEIKDVAIAYGGKVIDRPALLSGDIEPTVSALKHVLEMINFGADNIVLLQPTNPLRPEELLLRAYNYFIKNNCESLFTVSQNHHKLGKIKDSKFIPFNYALGQRSQDMEDLYFENGLLYITKAKLIMQDTIISESAFPYVVNHPFSKVDIDTQEDLDYAEHLFGKYSARSK